jgi:hypothetical protein
LSISIQKFPGNSIEYFPVVRARLGVPGSLFALLETVGVVAGFEDVAMVGEAVQQGGGHLGVAEDLHPFAEVEVGGDDERGLLVELADQVEQQRAAGVGERQVAQLVEDDGVDLDQLPGEVARASPVAFPFPGG